MACVDAGNAPGSRWRAGDQSCTTFLVTLILEVDHHMLMG